MCLFFINLWFFHCFTTCLNQLKSRNNFPLNKGGLRGMFIHSPFHLSYFIQVLDNPRYYFNEILHFTLKTPIKHPSVSPLVRGELEVVIAIVPYRFLEISYPTFYCHQNIFHIFFYF